MTQWIAQLRTPSESPGDAIASPSGPTRDAAAQQELWDRYFRRIVGLARTKLGDLPRGAADEEDVAISAMQSLFHGFAHNRFPRLGDRHNLWSLLAKMTARKAINQRHKLNAQKRGGGRWVASIDATAGDGDADGPRRDPLDDDLGPEFIVAMREELGRLLQQLPDERLRQIACLKLEGYTSGEIASRLGVVERTVERKLGLIRAHWAPEDDEALPATPAV